MAKAGERKKATNKTSTRSQKMASSGAKEASKKGINPQRRKEQRRKDRPDQTPTLGRAALRFRPRIGMAPKPAPRPHAAKNRVGALGLNGCLEPAADALAHRSLLRGELARWVRQTGEAGLSLIPKQSTNRFGNQSIGNGSAIAARRRMAEKRSERLISLCSLRARQRVDVPKRPQSRRSRQLQPPCLGSSKKKNNSDASKAAGKAFLFDFSTYRRKRRRRRCLQRLSTLSFAFFFGKRRLKRIIFLTTKRCDKSARKSARLQALMAQTLFFFKV